MADNAVDDQYFTYDARLASFNKTTKKRASGAGGRGAKALNWPHKRILPASLASAGFFFSPTPEHPDNVLCFLCHKGLDGWEEGDDPLHEHLNHTSGCGWATLAAIEAEVGDFHLGDPSAPDMVAARKATFAGRWPHESKRGWKCKTKQLVDSGWKYTPTPESDDMATCAYCQLALDGWEPADKPMDEHYKRAPNCPFFTLPSQTHGKKSTRGKASRTSKASRLSGQSALTAPSEIGSVDELTVALDDDTVLTTTSTMTAGGKKPRAKKAATAKGKKTRAKKEETVEPEEVPIVVDEEPTPQNSPPKPKRGKKRGSDAVEESTLTVADAPAPKKRATRGRASKAVDSSVVEPAEPVVEQPQEQPKKPAAKKRGRPSKAQAGRKASTSSRVSTMSTDSVQFDAVDIVNDDEEIERQLQADLERPLTDDEEIMADSDSERFKAKAKTTKNRKTTSTARSVDFDMFDPQPAQADDAAVEEELKQLEAEMLVDEPEQLEVPKKGRKAGTRKASKQTKPKKTKAAPAPQPEPEPEVEFEEIPLEAEEPLEIQHDDQQDDSLGSTDTVIRKTEPAAAKRGRGRPSKLSIASVMSEDELDNVQLVEPIEEDIEEETKSVKLQPPAKRPRGRPSKASLASRSSSNDEASIVNASQAPAKKGRGRPRKVEQQQVEEVAVPKPAQKAQQRKVSNTKKAPEHEPAPVPIVEEAEEDEIFEEPSSPIVERLRAPATPPRAVTTATIAKQTPVSPSPSPQSSDAENQPPSSKPSATQTKRIALAPIAETPQALSPSKRNIMAGLQSTTAWTAVDIDAMLGTPGRGGANKENGNERLIKKGKDLTSPEKQMTVEEWVYYNAGQAEKMLKQECEAMVSRFESEGARAMNVLEGLVVD